MTGLKPTAQEVRAEQLRPYLALYAAVIQLAVADVNRGGYRARTEAASWLFKSDVAAMMLSAIGIEPGHFRDRLLTKPAFVTARREAAPASARLSKPLLVA